MTKKGMIIEGAAVMPDVEIRKKDIKLPDIDMEYRGLINVNGIPFVTKDFQHYVIAISVILNGEKRNPLDLIQVLEEVNGDGMD